MKTLPSSAKSWAWNSWDGRLPAKAIVRRLARSSEAGHESRTSATKARGRPSSEPPPTGVAIAGSVAGRYGLLLLESPGRRLETLDERCDALLCTPSGVRERLVEARGLGGWRGGRLGSGDRRRRGHPGDGV